MLINKIVVYEILKILKQLKRGHYIQQTGTVWCILWYEGVIRTLLLRKRRWNDCHRQFGAILTYDNELYFLPVIAEYDSENLWFQQDGATCHTARANMALLQETFPGRVISRLGYQDHGTPLGLHYSQKKSLFGALFGAKV